MNANSDAVSALSRKPASCPQHLRSFAFICGSTQNPSPMNPLAHPSVTRHSPPNKNNPRNGSGIAVASRPKTNRKWNRE